MRRLLPAVLVVLLTASGCIVVPAATHPSVAPTISAPSGPPTPGEQGGRQSSPRETIDVIGTTRATVKASARPYATQHATSKAAPPPTRRTSRQPAPAPRRTTPAPRTAAPKPAPPRPRPRTTPPPRFEDSPLRGLCRLALNNPSAVEPEALARCRQMYG